MTAAEQDGRMHPQDHGKHHKVIDVDPPFSCLDTPEPYWRNPPAGRLKPARHDRVRHPAPVSLHVLPDPFARFA
jgi:hypothetical protein